MESNSNVQRGTAMSGSRGAVVESHNMLTNCSTALHNFNTDIRHSNAEIRYSSYCAMQNIYVDFKFLCLVA